jgi:UDP-N-acetylmuramyl tripeptide synthase
VLEAAAADSDAALLEAWKARVQRAKRHLGWPVSAVVAIPHAGGASLALAAPPDQLITATELNEWALAAALLERNPSREAELLAALAFEQPDALVAPGIEEAGAMQRLRARAAGEANPRLRALLDAAHGRTLPCLLDDEFLTIGAGIGGRTWPLSGLPDMADVSWAELRAIPVALVTGTNGKTTVVRLVAACAHAEGWTTGHSCTDGVYIGGVSIEAGDYSGPAGARTVLRDTRVQAAVLETARGGILRRGLAITRADAAVITSVSADHFGEYGVHDLAALVDAKLTVARALDGNGRLIVNADDALLAARSPAAGKPIAWFAQDANHERLAAHRQRGGATCGVAAGRLLLSAGADEHDLGAVATLPLTAGGYAHFNIANLAAAALAASALGIRPATIAAVFTRFGADPMDNPGRLMRYELGGLQLVVDFAHNPAALANLLELAGRLRQGRLALLLGQAGNRTDTDLRNLATVAAASRPDIVVIKEITSHLRGRGVGEVPAVLRGALARAGLPVATIQEQPDEISAVRAVLSWARPGDVLALPVHTRAARAETLALLQRLSSSGWRAGKPLPA